MADKHSPHPLLRTHKLTFGQKSADFITKWAGSWIFIITLLVAMTFWILWNMKTKAQFDPYPFILLNFVLSTLAALQAPIILMSGNREAQRDRLAANYDHAVNRKAEREIQNMQKDLDEIKELIRKRNSKK